MTYLYGLWYDNGLKTWSISITPKLYWERSGGALWDRPLPSNLARRVEEAGYFEEADGVYSFEASNDPNDIREGLNALGFVEEPDLFDQFKETV
jgi:hypothetical protein